MLLVPRGGPTAVSDPSN